MSEADTIVAKLTPGEIEALLNHRVGAFYGSSERGWPESAHDPCSFNKAGRRLMRLGLICWHPKRVDSRTQLTPLGARVRDVIARLTPQP